MSNAMVKYSDQGVQLSTVQEMMTFCDIIAKASMINDVKSGAQALVKVQAGQELGVPPIQALSGIHVINGKVALGAGIMASLIKRSGKYDYRIVKHSDEVCEIAFFQGKDEVGRSSFSVADAQKAGIKNPMWAKYARNMLFARALSNGARWYCPDVFGGPVYTPEELGANVDSQGEVLSAVVVEAPATRKPRAQAEQVAARAVEAFGGSVTVEAPEPEDPPAKPSSLKDRARQAAAVSAPVDETVADDDVSDFLRGAKEVETAAEMKAYFGQMKGKPLSEAQGERLKVAYKTEMARVMGEAA